jgi:hypothetical protein
LFGDPSTHGVPVTLPNGQEGPGWATAREFWIRNNVWRETIFEGNADDSMAAADALIDHGLLRVKLTSEGRERTTNVRVREQIFRRTKAVAEDALAILLDHRWIIEVLSRPRIVQVIGETCE